MIYLNLICAKFTHVLDLEERRKKREHATKRYISYEIHKTHLTRDMESTHTRCGADG
jgi:hypothetical protein